MIPKTRFQKEVVRLADGLPGLTEKQLAYAFKHCFSHYACRTKGGIITCTECGHRWRSEHQLVETVCGCTCPNCGTELALKNGRKRIFKDREYFSIITTCKGFQVVRFFIVQCYRKVGQPVDYSIHEVVQRWIAADGRYETIARMRYMSSFYYDLWSVRSRMEIRSNKNLGIYNIYPCCIYPVRKYIREVKRNGFNGNFYGLSPAEFFKEILSDSRKETLLKAGQVDMFRYSIKSAMKLQDFWGTIKICMRNGYIITDASLWCDYIKLLRHFGKDTSNAKYVCPVHLNEEHDKWVRKKNVEMERQRRALEIEWRNKRAEQVELARKVYLEQKANYLDLTFTDGEIFVHVLRSVDEFMEEGKAMHHCVYTNEYYLNESSLILSATIDSKRVETVEFSLDTMKVIQSRGVCNSLTEYHDRIVKLVENNAGLIEQRVAG